MKRNLFTVWLVLILICQILLGYNFSFIDILGPVAPCQGASYTVEKNGSQDFTHIQWAIDNASAGDTILVFNGTYNENLIIDKSITLKGNASSGTKIRGSGRGDVIYINASWVNVSGFNIRNSGRTGIDAGIKIIGSDNCRILENNCSNNQYGIYLIDSDNNTINNNTAKIKSVVEDYQKKILLSPVTPDADYQIKIEIDKDNFDYSRAKANGDDIRFHTKGGNKLYYWIESWDPQGMSVIWVKIPSAGTSELYMSYGDATANSESDGEKTFDLFDDFSAGNLDLTKWDADEWQAGTHSYNIANGELHVYAKSVGATSGYSFFSKKGYNTQNFSIIAKGRWANLDNWRGGGIFLGPNMFDNDNDRTSISLALGGDQRNVLNIYKENAKDVSQNVADFSSGNAQFEYNVVGNSFSMNVTGSYSYSKNLNIGGFNRPFRVGLDAYMNHWTGNVEVDSYYDYVIMRKYSTSEPGATLIDLTLEVQDYTSGISMESSANNTFSGNDLNGTGFFISGPSLKHWNSHTMDPSNKINDKPLCYQKNEVSGSISDPKGQVILANCTHMNIYDQNITNCTAPILLGFSDNNTVRNNTCGWGKYGIRIYNGESNTVKFNDCANNVQGINIDSGENNSIKYNNLTLNENGIVIDNGGNNTIKQNNCHSNHTGIRIESSHGNNIHENDCDSNVLRGISLNQSVGNEIVKNNCRNNKNGIHMDNSTGNSIENNNCSKNEAGIRSVSSPENTIRENLCDSNTFFGIDLAGSEKNSIINNTCTNNEQGIFLCEESSSTVTNNKCTDNDRGIHLWKSSDNSLQNSTLTNNEYGIYLRDSINNSIGSNTGSEGTVGLLLEYGEDNSIGKNTFGSMVEDGINILQSDNNTIARNSCTDCQTGINVSASQLNTINNNILDNNTNAVFLCGSSTFNDLDGNVITKTDSQYGLYFFGEDTYDNTVSRSNEVNNIPVRWYTGETGITLDQISVSEPRMTNTAQVMLYRCSNVHLSNCTVANGISGLILFSSDNNTITDADISNSAQGISLHSSEQNEIITNEVTNSTNGIYLDSSDNNLIEDNSVDECGAGLFLLGSADNEIRRNTAWNNTEGILVESSNWNLVDNNTLFNNTDGIYLHFGANNTVSNNSAFNNTNGILLESTEENTVNDNNFSDDQVGLYLRESDGNTLENNTCNSNLYSGIHLHLSKNNIIGSNTCSGNDDGIRFTSSANNFIINNTCKKNTQMGIDIYGNGNTLTNNRCFENRLGIYIHFSSSTNLIDNNTCNRNERNGIQLTQSPANFVTNNTCMHNYRMGILLSQSDSVEVLENICDENNLTGIYLSDSHDNTIAGNTMRNNNESGIYLHSSDDNEIRNNFIKLNIDYGIYVNSGSDNNDIHHNDLIFNHAGGIQGCDKDGGNNWDDGGGQGNFWSDYISRYPLASNDGVTWDTPYQIDGGAGGKDDHPLAFVTFEDDSPPTFVDDLSTQNATTGDVFDFSLNVTDNICNIGAWASYSFDDLTFHNISLIYSGDDIWANTTVLLQNATNLTYYFSVLDAGGNWRRFQGSHITVIDNDKPLLIRDNSVNFATTGDPYEIVANITDNIGIDFVRIIYTFDGIHYHNESLFDSGTGKWNRTLDIPSWAAFITYYYYFGDTAGNTNMAGTRNITVTDNDLPVLITDSTQESPTTGEDFLFSARFTDNMNMAFARVGYAFDSSNFFNFSLVNENSTLWTFRIKINSRATNLTYFFYFEDEANNKNHTSSKTIPVRDNDVPVYLTDQTSGSTTTGEGITFFLMAADNIEVTSAYVNYTFDNISFTNESLEKKNEMSFRLNIDVPMSALFLRYVYCISDEALNLNVSSARIIVVHDNQHPFLVTDSTSTTPTTGDPFTFSAILRDNVGIFSAYVNYSFHETVPQVIMLDHGGDGVWTGIVTIPSDSTVMDYFICFMDFSGNSITSSVTSLTVMDNDEPVTEAGPDVDAKKGDRVVFNGTKSRDNIAMANFTWSFDYNNETVELFGPDPSFTFLLVGNYSVRLSARDITGNTADDILLVSISEVQDGGPGLPDDDDDDDELPEEPDTRDKEIAPASKIPLWISVPIQILALIIVCAVLFIVIKRRERRTSIESPAEMTSDQDSGIEEDRVVFEEDIQDEARDGEMDSDEIPPPPREPEIGPLAYTLPGERQSKPVLMGSDTGYLPGLRISGETTGQIKALPQSTTTPTEIPLGTEGIGGKAPGEPPLAHFEGTMEYLPASHDRIISSRLLEGVPVKPIMSEPIVSEPIVSRPIVSEPVMSEPIVSEPPPPPGAFFPAKSVPEALPEKENHMPRKFISRSRKKTSYLSVKRSMVFKMEDSMPCSICYGDISEGVDAIRCPCGEICHLSCGMKMGQCAECGADYEDILSKINKEEVIKSIEDSNKTAKREVEEKVEWDDTEDMLKQLLRKVLNNEMSVEEYKMLSEDLKGTR